MTLTPHHLISICGRCNHADEYAPLLWDEMVKGEITTVTRAAAFLAQLAHESQEFNILEEESTGAYYEGRINLGNIGPGDGPKYKGRGFIQITGRYNYQRAGEALGINLEDQPFLASVPSNAAAIARWYWTLHGLNGLADMCDFLRITKEINGGLNGLQNRQWYFHRALAILGVGANI